MNELAMNGDRRMTVREVAEALGVDASTITKRVRDLYPEVMRNGVTTYLDEIQVATIKAALISNGHLGQLSEVQSATTDVEMAQKTVEVIKWAMSKIETLQSDLAIAAPKAVLADRIASADGLKSLSEIGKINGIGPRKIFEILADAKILYRSGKNWVPYQQYVDAGYFIVRESTYEMNGIDHLYSKTYVTGKGEVWLAGHLVVDHVLVIGGNHEH